MQAPEHSPLSTPKLGAATAKTAADESQTIKDSHPAPDAPHAPLSAPRIPDHELLARIGRGSYGEVWLARNVMGTYRAIKIVYRATFEHARPFDREFNGIKKFEPISRSHDGLVDILQVGRTDECFFYVMELADDEASVQEIDPASYAPKTLRSELKAQGRLLFESCVQLGISLTQALGYMHARGLIHRDIKPSNIIFVNGLPKLADIGLVAEQSEAKSFVGTEGFIPPEGPGTPQADLYSLGKVLYEIATGKDRHEFPELPALLNESESDTSLLELNSVFLKACQSDVKLRYQTAEQMRDDLLLLQSGKSVKRAQAVERRFKFLKRMSVVGSTVTSLVVAGFAYTQHQAIRAQRAEQETRRQLYVSDMILAERALDSGNVRRAVELLDTHRPKPGTPDLRGFEYYYLRQQCEGEQLFTIQRQENAIFAVAYSPDGKGFATGSSYREERDFSGALKLFEADSGKEVHQFDLPSPGGIRSVAFSPDGNLFASGTAESVVILWNARTRERLDAFFGKAAEAASVVFSPDSKLLAAAFWGPNLVTSGRIVIWDTQTRQEASQLKVRTPFPNALAFSPNGKWLAYADVLPDYRPVIRLWELATKRDASQIVLSLGGRNLTELQVPAVDFPRDSSMLAYGTRSGQVALWNLADEQVISLGKHEDVVLSVRFAPDGKLLATGSADGTIKLWDPRTKQMVRLLRGHHDSVEQIAFSPNAEQLASASTDRTVRIWSLAPKPESDVLRHHEGEVTAVEFSPGDGDLLATAGVDGTVKVWDLKANQLRRTLSGFAKEVQFLAFSPNATYLAARGADCPLRVWSTATWSVLTNVPATSEIFRGGSLRFSADGRFLFVSEEEKGAVKVLEAGSWRLVTNLVGSGTRTMKTACSLDGKILAVGGDEALYLYQIGTWHRLKTLTGHSGFVYAITFAPDKPTIISGSSDSSVRIWDAKQSPPKLVLGGQVGDVHALSVAPDGKTLAIADMSGVIKLRNLPSGKELFTLAGHEAPVSSLAFSSDGKLLASGGSDGTVRLWRAAASEDLAKRKAK